MATKSKNKKTSSAKPGGAKTGSTKGSNKQKPQVKKEHGALLTAVLVIIAVHGLIAAVAYSTMSTVPEVQRPWIVTAMVVHFLANVAAAVGIFYWKKWGLYVYAASTVIALVVGLVTIGMWSVFYMILPLVIVGWLLRTKWDYFE